MIKHLLAGSVIALGLAAGSSAQDINADPIYETVSLSAGFIPDPETVAVAAGGSNSAENAAPGCAGNISTSPDVRLIFDASNSATAAPLYISVDSNEDTTLVINAPDGQWYCNDDGGQGTNPAIIFGPAQSGRYEIWVGTYNAGDYADAVLHISEISSQ